MRLEKQVDDTGNRIELGEGGMSSVKTTEVIKTAPAQWQGARESTLDPHANRRKPCHGGPSMVPSHSGEAILPEPLRSHWCQHDLLHDYYHGGELDAGGERSLVKETNPMQVKQKY